MEEWMKEEEQFLSEGEALIMKVIWKQSEDITISELVDILNLDYEKDYKRSTVVTFLNRMVGKGFIRIWHKGRLAYIHALRTKEDYQHQLLEKQRDFWYDGSSSEMVASLIRSRQISEEDKKEIRRLLDVMVGRN